MKVVILVNSVEMVSHSYIPLKTLYSIQTKPGKVAVNTRVITDTDPRYLAPQLRHHACTDITTAVEAPLKHCRHAPDNAENVDTHATH